MGRRNFLVCREIDGRMQVWRARGAMWFRGFTRRDSDGEGAMLFLVIPFRPNSETRSIETKDVNESDVDPCCRCQGER